MPYRPQLKKLDYYETGSGGSGGASTFLDLIDTPSSYEGEAEKFVRVKEDEDGLEFVEVIPSGGVEWGKITGNLPDQEDLQTALDNKEPTITAGTITDYWRGDKTWQSLNIEAISGLSEVLSDKSNKPHDNQDHNDLEFDILQFTAQIPPIDPPQESKYVYVKTEGSSPNKEISLCLKNELGIEIIISSIIV